MSYELKSGKMEDILPQLNENRFHSCVTDFPYGIGFMGNAWDKFDIEKRHEYRNSRAKNETVRPGRKTNGFGKSLSAGKYDQSLNANRNFQEWVRMQSEHIYRVLRPGAHYVNFCSPRTFHRMCCGIEDAGFEIREVIMWVFGSGFPKSHNLDGQWDGFGTALKPAYEPIIIARKPLQGTVKENMDKWGTGAINIDACRIPGEPWRYGNQPKLNGARYQPGQLTPKERHAENVVGGEEGRWPANLILDGSDGVITAFPCCPTALGKAVNGGEKTNQIFGKFKENVSYNPIPREDSSKSAARFFYHAKTSRLDRNEGCEKMEEKQFSHDGRTVEIENAYQRNKSVSQNNHPTVKPTNLMRYLVRLVTPQGGEILDPCCGSGSTGKAAMYEFKKFYGIDMDPHNIEISEARIKFAIKNRDYQTSIF